MPDIGASAWTVAVAQHVANTNTDAKATTVEGRQRRESRRSSRLGSQCPNSCPKAHAPAQIKVFAIGSAQIADPDAVESSEVSHAEQHADAAKGNLAGGAVIANAFRRE